MLSGLNQTNPKLTGSEFKCVIDLNSQDQRRQSSDWLRQQAPFLPEHYEVELSLSQRSDGKFVVNDPAFSEAKEGEKTNDPEQRPLAFYGRVTDMFSDGGYQIGNYAISLDAELNARIEIMYARMVRPGQQFSTKTNEPQLLTPIVSGPCKELLVFSSGETK
jgi:hypothetical protein